MFSKVPDQLGDDPLSFKREIENFIITVGFNMSQGKFQIYVKFWKKRNFCVTKTESQNWKMNGIKIQHQNI